VSLQSETGELTKYKISGIDEYGTLILKNENQTFRANPNLFSYDMVNKIIKTKM